MAEEAENAPESGEGGSGAVLQRVDPYRAYNFTLLTGVSQGHFTECSAPGVRINPIRYVEGGDQIVHQLAGRVEYTEVTLRYGLTDSAELWEWLVKSIEGTPEYRNVSIVMQGPGGIGEGVGWNLNDAWPCQWRGAPLNAQASEIAIESLTLCYESISRR